MSDKTDPLSCPPGAPCSCRLSEKDLRACNSHQCDTSRSFLGGLAVVWNLWSMPHLNCWLSSWQTSGLWRRAFWTTQSYCDRVQYLDACSLIMRKISRLGFRVYAEDDWSCRCKSWFQAVLLMRAVWSRCVVCVFMSVSVSVSEWAHPCGVIEMLGVRISLCVMIWRCKGIVALAVWGHIYSSISSMRTHGLLCSGAVVFRCDIL